MLSLSDLKNGAIIKYNSEPCVIISAQHLKLGRGGAILKTKIKNLLTGQILDKTLRGNDKVEEADLEKTKANFLYQDNQSAYFMDRQSYEQFSLTKKQLGNQINYLIEGLEVEVLNFNHQPVSIELPPKANLKVISAPPGVRGNTAQGKVTKPIILETGLKINAPLFVKEGDVIKINTQTGEYVERVSRPAVSGRRDH